MASKMLIKDRLPPHRDGTPNWVCSGVSKTRGGKQECAFLQLLVCTESPQSKETNFFAKIQKANTRLMRPPSFSLLLGPLAVTPELHERGKTFSSQSVRNIQQSFKKNCFNKKKVFVTDPQLGVFFFLVIGCTLSKIVLGFTLTSPINKARSGRVLTS